MKRKASIFFSLFVLLVMSAGSFFFYAYLDIEEVALKVTAYISQHGNSDGELAHIKVSLKDFNKKDHEIWSDGHLYDIAAYKITGDSVQVSVIHDEKEEGLVEIISDHFESHGVQLSDNTGNRLSSKHVCPVNDTKCLCRPIAILFRNSSSALCYGNFAEKCSSSTYSAISGPPPKS